MRNEFTAVIERDGELFVAWSPEIPGASGQGRSVEECRENLAAAIRLIQDDQRNAESDPLDRRHFELSEKDFRRFTAMLDAPPKSNPRLARLLKRSAPWDEPQLTSPAALAPAQSNALRDRGSPR